MAENKSPAATSTNKQKIMGAVFVVILLIIIWQVWGLFGGSSTTEDVAPKPTPVDSTAQTTTATKVTTTTTAPMAANNANNAMMQAQANANMQKESELLRLQREAQAKYLAAIDSLQMLKVEREIAETNQAIATAKLAKVKAEKDVLDLFSRPAQAPVPTSSYAASLVSPMGAAGPASADTLIGGPLPPSYVVLSVSYVNKRWAAVIGNQGKLYNVGVGDILPPDSSVVVSIDRTGVVLRKDDDKRKVSLVPVI